MVITFIWSRAVNLLICNSADTKEFLRQLQIHVYTNGIFSNCYSDMGTQITAGAKLIRYLLSDAETRSFFEEKGRSHRIFSPYPPGNSSLGSVVETMVKQTKSFLIKAIGKTVISDADFELIVKTNHLLNRRPLTNIEH